MVKKNLKTVVSLLSVAGIILLLISAFIRDHHTKYILYYTSGALLIAVVVCYAIYAANQRAFRDRSQ